ncbi:MAG: cell division protein FtsA, partial [Patescibacteria group bacterium]
MKKSTFAIGIDLGTESIKTVALEISGGDATPKVLGIGGSISKGFKRGSIIDPQEAALPISEAIASLIKSSGVPKENIYAGIGGLGISFQKSKGLVVISRADGEVSKEDMKRAVLASEAGLSRIQNKDVLHRIPLLYKVDGEMPTQDPSGLSGNKLEVETMFVLAQSPAIKSAIKSFEEAGVDAEEIVASPFLVSKAVLEKRETEVGVMVLDLGATTSSISLFEDGLPYSLEVLGVGSGHVTQDIAVGFQIDLDEAEKIKLDFRGYDKFSKKDEMIHGKYSKKKIADIVEARFMDIFELVEKHLKKVDRMGLLPAGVVIVGGGANFPGIEEIAKDYLRLPARVGHPQGIEGASEIVKNPAWSTAVGIALYGLENSKNSFLRGRSGS